MKMTRQEESHLCIWSVCFHTVLCISSLAQHRKWTPNPPCQTEFESSSFLSAHQTNKNTLYKHLDYICPQEKTTIPELILERSHFLMQSWCTYCRLPVHLQGSIRGLELDWSPIWQIRHRSPSSSSESSNRRLKVRRGYGYNQQTKTCAKTKTPATQSVPNPAEFRSKPIIYMIQRLVLRLY